MRSILLGLFAGMLVCNAGAAELSGTADYVVDGDTFDLTIGKGMLRVRLCGVDSPEKAQIGFGEAKRALHQLIQGKRVRCVQTAPGAGTPCDGRSQSWSRDRVVAQCFLGQIDLAAEMVRTGNACDWPKFSGGYYSQTTRACIRH